MTMKKIATLTAFITLVSACGEGPGTFASGRHAGDVDRSRDGGFDSKPLTDLIPGIWVDPNGCDHWIIDDGLEGYLSERLTPDGRPVCSNAAAPNAATQPFKEGSSFGDLL